MGTVSGFRWRRLGHQDKSRAVTYVGVDHEPLFDLLANVDDGVGGGGVAQPHPDLVALRTHRHDGTVDLESTRT